MMSLKLGREACNSEHSQAFTTLSFRDQTDRPLGSIRDEGFGRSCGRRKNTGSRLQRLSPNGQCTKTGKGGRIELLRGTQVSGNCGGAGRWSLVSRELSSPRSAGQMSPLSTVSPLGGMCCGVNGQGAGGKGEETNGPSPMLMVPCPVSVGMRLPRSVEVC